MLPFRLFFHCCNVHLLLTVAHRWLCRCSFKLHENYFAIYCGSLRSQPYEGHRLTVFKMSWIMLCINNMKCLEVKLFTHVTLPLFWHNESICGIGWALPLINFFSCLSQPFPLLRRPSKKFPDWKAFLRKTSLVIQSFFFKMEKNRHPTSNCKEHKSGFYSQEPWMRAPNLHPERTLKSRRDAELLQFIQICVNSCTNPCNPMAAWIVITGSTAPGSKQNVCAPISLLEDFSA